MWWCVMVPRMVPNYRRFFCGLEPTFDVDTSANLYFFHDSFMVKFARTCPRPQSILVKRSEAHRTRLSPGLLPLSDAPRCKRKAPDQSSLERQLPSYNPASALATHALVHSKVDCLRRARPEDKRFVFSHQHLTHVNCEAKNISSK